MKFVPFSEKQLTALCWWLPDSSFESYDAIICDGAVRSGKSLSMFVSFMLWSMASFNGSSFAVCAKTASSARRNLITPMLPIIISLGFQCDYSVSKNVMTVTLKGKSNKYYIFGGKDESSASLIQGMTLSGVLFDEVVLMPRSFVEQALARCSVEGSRFWFNCNPDNPSNWFYREWIKKAEQKNALYLHFSMRENPSLSPKMIKRYESLYTGVFYRRFILGEWVAAEGAVYPMFNDSAVCDPPSEPTEYYVSIDYGTVNPTSMGLWGKVGAVWYRVREYYYASRTKGKQLTDEEYYAELKRLVLSRRIKAVIIDPSAASFIALIKRRGEFKVIPADNRVVDGIRRVGSALRLGDIKISPCCTDALREFSLYVWDSSLGKDCPKKENDHAMDEIRYFVMTVLNKKKKGFAAATAVRDKENSYENL